MPRVGQVPCALAVAQGLDGYSILVHSALPVLSASASVTGYTTLTRTRGCVHCVISACKCRSTQCCVINGIKSELIIDM